MKAKLIKHILVKADEGKYFLFKEDENEFRTQLFHKLSKQNCDEIFGVVDVDKWVKGKVDNRFNETDGYHKVVYVEGLVEGFNKAMELNKDKLFTLEDMKKAIELARETARRDEFLHSENRIIQKISQQPTEIEVMIVMEEINGEINGGTYKVGKRYQPKLDSEGCPVLIKKI
jgi:hypothetical protein